MAGGQRLAEGDTRHCGLRVSPALGMVSGVRHEGRSSLLVHTHTPDLLRGPVCSAICMFLGIHLAAQHLLSPWSPFLGSLGWDGHKASAGGRGGQPTLSYTALPRSATRDPSTSVPASGAPQPPQTKEGEKSPEPLRLLPSQR